MSLAIDSLSGTHNTAMLGVERSLNGRRWRARVEDDREALLIAQRFGLPEIVGRVLAGRGVPASEAEGYLNPNLKSLLPNPSSFVDMDKATERLTRAILDGEEIAAFGDYDVDGATSTAVLKRYLDLVGGRTRVYIPDRLLEGYGPNAPALCALAEDGVSLVVTVDCGISAFAPLAKAAEIGLDLIVVDHHATGDELPLATAIINPKRTDDTSDCGHLAAVGLAFLLCVSVNRKLRMESWFEANSIVEPDLLTLLDLVALGTVCDVVPLSGVNRAFVTQGLKVLSTRQNVGLRALCDVAELNHEAGAEDLGFQLGPRVNAGGRVGRADLGSRLLVTADPAEAKTIAAQLDAYNQERKTIERDVESKAYRQVVERGLDSGLEPVIVVSGSQWHPGVIGIVASRLKDRFSQPCIVLSLADDGTAKGSGRSVPGVDLGAAIVGAHRAGLLINGGGHPMAAGLTIEAAKIPELEDYLATALVAASADSGQKELELDGVLSPGGASRDLLDLIGQAGPYGAANPEPRFAFPNVRANYADIVGGAHVRCTLAGEDGKTLKAIAFRCNDTVLGQTLLSSNGAPLHVAGWLKPDHWRGRGAVQLHISDIALPDQN